MDQGVRDIIAEELDSTLFVEAGAGTGKTTALVARVVALVRSGRARIEEIAAITFTEAAAAELRDRLAEEFERLALSETDGRAAEAARALDAAAVTTLHGFARKILAEQPFSVGLPPLFDVADESSDQVAFDERWERLSATLLEEPDYEDLVVRALSCGLSWKVLRQVALQCHRNWDLLQGLDLDVPNRPSLDPAHLLDLLQQATSRRENCLDPEDRLAGFLDGPIARSRVTVAGAADEIDLLQILVGIPPLGSGNKGQMGNWPDGGKAAVAECLALAEEERARLVDVTVQWVMRTMLTLLVAFTLEGARERRISGHLTFHDLLVLAREVVRDHPSARRELHRRYLYILIDEFQDTDPIQADLAVYLATDSEDLSGDWLKLSIPPGRLFFVGDPKQSIYRFRRADIELFMTVRDRLVGGALQLTTNFRSRPAIIEWANAVFAGIFGDGEPGMQPAYEQLAPGKDQECANPNGLAPVIVLGHEPLEGSAEDVREVQAREVVTAISTMHAEAWPLGTEATPMRLSDVAILIPTRTGLPTLERAFEAAGVPYRLESSSLAYQSQEVQQLLAILRAVDDPADAVSVLAALRSPAFGCGDDDLFRHHAQGGKWDWRFPGDAHTAVGEALADLATTHAHMWWRSVSALVYQVVTDRRLMALALSKSRPRESWRRIRFLLDQARLFDEANGGDLRAFLRWVEHQQNEEARVTEAIVPEADDDAVRVVTVHGAKGLEYPVVVLLGLQAPQVSRNPPLLFTPEGPQVRFQKGMETPGYQAAADREAAMEHREQQRLLYVAATRAKELLVVSVHRGTKNATRPTLATQLMQQCTHRPALWSDGGALCAAAPEPVPQRVHEDPEPDGPDLRDAFRVQRQELLARMARPRTLSATGVQSLLRSGQEVGPEEEMLERASSVQRRGRAGTAVGRAVHAVLQVIDLETGEGLAALAHAQAVAEGVTGREAEVRALVEAALASDLVGQAVRSGQFWREMYIGVPVGEGVLEGFIDLLFETPNGLAVVDYKTDRLHQSDDHDQSAARYRLQGASYALAAQGALGQPVASCTFLFLSTSGATAVPLIDLGVAMTEVTDIMSHPIVDVGAKAAPTTVA